MSDRLTERQKRFAEQLAAGATQQAAAIAAGYSAASAAQQASRLLRDPRVLQYRNQLTKEACDRLGLTLEKLALELEEIKQRCMTAKPHLSWNHETKDWEPDGTWLFDPNGAIKAISKQAELLGIEDPTKETQTIRIEFAEGAAEYGV